MRPAAALTDSSRQVVIRNRVRTGPPYRGRRSKEKAVMSDQIELVARATELTANVVAGVKPDQLDSPTPCTEWTVRDLINHMVGASELFASAGEGERSTINPFGHPDDLVGDDPAGVYEATRTKL